MSRQTAGLLSQITFSILLALGLKPRHGYELIQQIEHDSQGRIKLGPGALYATLKRLSENNLIEEMPFEDENERRRYYRLTRKGLNQLNLDLKYFESTIRLARERNLLDNTAE